MNNSNHRFYVALLALLVAVLPTPAVTAAGGRYSVVRKAEYLMIMLNDAPVAGYRILPISKEGKYSRNNYVDLYDLQGREVTEDFPADHPHHRGVFWAWHQVIVGDKHLGDSWECRDFTWNSLQVETSNRREGLLLRTRTHWSSPDYVNDQGQEIPVVREETNVFLHRTRSDYRVIDFQITIHPLVDGLKLGGAANDKGYGGFSPRIALPADIKFWSVDGQVTPARTAVDAGPWINMEGSFHSHDSTPSSIAIIGHTTNPAYPDKWILRAKGSMQNAAYPGQHPVAVPESKPLELRYRMVIQNGGHDPKRMERLSRQFQMTR